MGLVCSQDDKPFAVARCSLYHSPAKEQGADSQSNPGGGITVSLQREAEVLPAGRQLSETEREIRHKGEYKKRTKDYL